MILERTAPAESDLIEILDYIAEDKPTAALTTVDRIEVTALRLADFPELASGYDRSSRDPEKQEALDAWGRRLMMIVSGPQGCDASV